MSLGKGRFVFGESPGPGPALRSWEERSLRATSGEGLAPARARCRRTAQREDPLKVTCFFAFFFNESSAFSVRIGAVAQLCQGAGKSRV